MRITIKREDNRYRPERWIGHLQDSAARAAAQCCLVLCRLPCASETSLLCSSGDSSLHVLPQSSESRLSYSCSWHTYSMYGVVCKRWNHHLTPTCKVMSTVFRNGSFSGVRRWQETLHFEGVAVVDTSVTPVEEKLSCRIYSFDCF